jgi:hypothetical protein
VANCAQLAPHGPNLPELRFKIVLRSQHLGIISSLSTQ